VVAAVRALRPAGASDVYARFQPPIGASAGDGGRHGELRKMNARMSAALAWGGVLLAGALWGGGALVAQFLIDGGVAPQSLSLARFALGLPLLWWLHWRAPLAAGAGWASRTWARRCRPSSRSAAPR
jgi:DME family drug/metabolite transporter